MLGLMAFDPFRAELQRSSYRMGKRDRQATIDIAAELVAFFEGNQRAYLEEHILATFKNPKLQETYKRLAFFVNVTQQIVEQVTILGKRRLEVTFTTENGTPHEEDQKLWNRVADSEIADGGFDAFIATLGSYAELCKTAVALPYWDALTDDKAPGAGGDGQLCLGVYTPNVLDLSWELHGRPLRPDGFRILIDDSTQRYQVWDFTEDPALVYETEGDKRVTEPTPYSVMNPRTQKSLIPFVPFRTRRPTWSYFVDDGQAQLAEGQKAINRLWTQLLVLSHYGAFKVAKLYGPWATAEGKAVDLSLDPSIAVQIPQSRDGEKADLSWDGPANEGMIAAHLSIIEAATRTLASTFHIAPNDVQATANPKSGVSLMVGGGSLKEKQARSAMLNRPSAIQLVENITLVWNEYAAASRGHFSGKSKIDVRIPEQPISLSPLDDAELDALKVDRNFVLLDDVIKKHNPGIDEAKVEKIKAQKTAAQASTFPSVTGGGPRSLFRPSAGGGGNPNPGPQPPMPRPGMRGQKPPTTGQ